MEELVLGLYLTGDKLDVVHQHQVGFPVLGAEVPGLSGADGLNEVVDELVAFDVEDSEIRAVLPDDVGDGVEEVGFSQTGVAVDKEGVVVLAGRVGHGPGGGAGQAVGRADHEGLEGEFAALHQGGGLLFLLVLVLAEHIVVQEPHGDVGGKDVLKTGLDAGEEAVLNIGAFKAVGAVEHQRVSLQSDNGGFVEPGFDGGLGEILPHSGQDHGPDIGNRLHRLASFLS